jgi:DNA-binding HxlR family transcriptional regulator
MMEAIMTKVRGATDVGRVSETMSRVRAALGSVNGIGADREELLEQLAAQITQFESVRNHPIVDVVDHVGNYWRNWLLVILRTGPYRPSTIRRLLAALDPAHPISQRMLTLNLRVLERDGLVAREVVDDEQLHVDYMLTALGRELSDRIMSLIDWIDQHAEEVLRARAAFDDPEAG